MPDSISTYLDQILKRLNSLERRIAELERADKASTTLAFKDGVTAPTAVSGLALLYVDTADGDLKVRFGDNVTKTIATDT